MVQLDGALVQVLPDAEADISAGRWKKCIFKFSSIRMPGLEGFEELEGCWGVRTSRREIIIESCSVKHMPQTHDGGRFLRISVRVRADERNRGGGSSFERNGATTSLGVGGGEQQPRHRQNKGSGAESTVQKSLEDFGYSSIHCHSFRFLRMKEHAEKGDFRLPFPLRRTVRGNSKESNAPGGDFFIPC